MQKKNNADRRLCKRPDQTPLLPARVHSNGPMIPREANFRPWWGVPVDLCPTMRVSGVSTCFLSSLAFLFFSFLFATLVSRRPVSCVADGGRWIGGGSELYLGLG